ncbi:hypothetical protein GOP47_0011036 [Adiantum capillus-veneris]|uniref:Uncharacterized protein n=1 Tax=Adiantum capillus-veneris TaxID=13818 RepID=A0A9D4UTD2_ADICA|nr:hypothetical protein GOP47_0011036 [Adiantum capillus-veneris]
MDAVVARSHYHHCGSSSRGKECGDGSVELKSSILAPRLFSPSFTTPDSRKSSLSLVVRAGKGKRRFGAGIPQPQRIPSLPKIEDDGNPKFVIFVRDKQVPLWFPLNIVSGGSMAKMVVGAMGNNWGRSMAEGTLTRDLGKALYKDERAIRMTALKAHSMLKNAKELEFGFKIVNMDDQKSAFMPSNVIKIPPKEELKTPLDKVKDFFGDNLGGVKDAFNGLKLGDQDSESASNDSK